MENFSSFIQVLVALFLILSVIMNYGQRIEIKSLTKKFDLLKKMFWEETNCLDDNNTNHASAELIEKLKEEIIYFYAKKIKEWDPDDIGRYFLGLEMLEDEKKRLILISLFKKAMASITQDDLVAIYFKAFILELDPNRSDDRNVLRTTKDLILETELRTGKSSRRIEIFYLSLEATFLKSYLNEEQRLISDAEMAEIKTILFNKSDII